MASYNDPVNSEDKATAIAVDGSGNVYVTGLSWGSGTGWDYATIKYDSSGNQLWVAKYDSPANNTDLAYAIAVDGSGNVYVTGLSVSSGIIPDYATVKYDPSGNQQWVARYDGPANSIDWAEAIAVDGSGNVYVTGLSNDSDYYSDYATIKYDTDGNEKWVARYGPANLTFDLAEAIAVDGSGNVYVTGKSYGSGTYYDYATIKYDTDTGEQLWVARYDGPGNNYDTAKAIAVDSSGNVYVTGRSISSGASNDYATIKYDTDGNEKWVARYDGLGNNYDTAEAIAVDSSGNVYVTGQSIGSGTSYDYATIKYDTNGNEEWVRRYNGPANSFDLAYAIAVDSSGNVYVTGWSNDSVNNSDYATIKYDSDTGEQLWAARYNDPVNSEDKATAIAVDTSGNVYVTGESYGGSGTSYDYATVKYSQQPDIYVDAIADGDNDGTSWADAYKYLQDALNDPELVGGAKVWVAAGTYTPDPTGLAETREATFQLVSGVAIYGGFPSGGGVWDDRNPNAYETILSGDLNGDDGPDFANNGENSYHVVTGSNTDETGVLDGFTITAGNANGDFQWPDARLCGGGMYNEWGSPTVANCTLIGNSAGGVGGGMCNYHGSPTVTDCTFSGNSAGHGGGMRNMTDSNPTVTNCTFNGNSAGDSGGGMHNYTDSSPILTNCSFIANSAHSGGGLCNYNYSSPTLTNCSFSGNSADDGGGMYNRYFSDPTLTNSTFSGNSAGDYGGGIYNRYNSSPMLTNSILWGNTATNGLQIALLSEFSNPSTVTVSYSDVQGGAVGVYVDTGCTLNWGVGNIDADPLFDGGVHLLPGSPCIDAGDNTAVPTGVTTDLDGNPRFMDDPETADTGNGTAPIVDMGAYEFPNTPTGTYVTVQPLDARTWTQPLTMTFAEVTEPGVTSLTTSSSGPEPPSGFMPGDPETYYDLSTTATYNGNIEVSIDYSGASYGNEANLKLYHRSNGGWVDITNPDNPPDYPNPDTANKIIRGTVDSLSLFAIFEPEEYQPPVIGAISAPLEPVQVNTTVGASASFWDPDIFDTHAAVWDWGDGSTSDGIVDEIYGIVYGSHYYTIPGVYTVTLTLTDGAGASDEAVFEYIVAYDPGAGFVTGGGWIWSPTRPYPYMALEGKANFGFVSKYKKGANVPTGNTEFQFKAGNLNFHSTSYDWLVVTGADYAMFKGLGTINGSGAYKFMLWAGDDSPDTFRIKIWTEDQFGVETIVYDNGFNQAIGGGSIVIHGG